MKPALTKRTRPHPNKQSCDRLSGLAPLPCRRCQPISPLLGTLQVFSFQGKILLARANASPPRVSLGRRERRTKCIKPSQPAGGLIQTQHWTLELKRNRSGTCCCANSAMSLWCPPDLWQTLQCRQTRPLLEEPLLLGPGARKLAVVGRERSTSHHQFKLLRLSRIMVLLPLSQ